MTARYALYFAPDNASELALYGERVLGRSATAPRKSDASSSFPDGSRWQTLTHKPAHYGFHATLKAPFELQHDASLDNLIEAVAKFAEKQRALSLTDLAPRTLSNFAALTLGTQADELTELAQSIVEAFEPFRQPLSDADIKRRTSQLLTPRQKVLLDRFGYPFVADEFRFHMTLSGPLNKTDDDYVAWLREQYESLISDVPVLNQLAVYAQADRQSPFVQIIACPFAR